MFLSIKFITSLFLSTMNQMFLSVRVFGFLLTAPSLLFADTQLSSLNTVNGPVGSGDSEIIRFASDNKQVHLIELYTSEGCSSCPPADAWLSEFKHDPELWNTFIPIAFHVDYWDWIGWDDPFASEENSERQKLYNKIRHVKSVYTPGLVLNGREWRIRNGIGARKPNAGKLEGTISKAKQVLELSYQAEHTSALDNRLVANVALLGFDIEVDVASGENKNRSLQHDFVLLKHQQQLSNSGQWKFTLPNIEDHSEYAKRFGIAVWIAREDDPSPLQASGSWF